MNESIKTLNYRVSGMTCIGCEAKIVRILERIPGVQSVTASYPKGMLALSYDEKLVSQLRIIEALEKAGYRLEIAGGGSGTVASGGRSSSGRTGIQLAVTAIVLLALYLVIDRTIGFGFIPEVTPEMGYGVLFIVGLLTSVHCIAMCGGICLTQSLPRATAGESVAVPAASVRRTSMMAGLLYNGGRVVSYTIIGGLAGALGSAVSLSGGARGLVAIVSGVFMIIMAVSMLGVPWMSRLIPRAPMFLKRRTAGAGKGKGPFIVGLLNGLMPCGPLQAMQIYALGTGSALAGAASMFFFSLGTVPLMFSLGAISAFAGRRFTARMLKAGAVLVLVLGLVMMNRGLALSGINILPSAAGQASVASAAVQEQVVIENGVQLITGKITAGSYPEITVKAGIPVKWTLIAEAEDLNGCNNAIIIPAFGIERELIAGENIIEFMPEKTGTIPYSCWMGMITSRITIIE